jgi:hypothetical protein
MSADGDGILLNLGISARQEPERKQYLLDSRLDVEGRTGATCGGGGKVEQIRTIKDNAPV